MKNTKGGGSTPPRTPSYQKAIENAEVSKEEEHAPHHGGQDAHEEDGAPTHQTTSLSQRRRDRRGTPKKRSKSRTDEDHEKHERRPEALRQGHRENLIATGEQR